MTLTTITQVAYTTAAIIKRGMTAAADLLMALSLRGVAIDGKMDVADKAVSFGICCLQAEPHSRERQVTCYHVMGIICWLDRARLSYLIDAGSDVPPSNLSSSSVHRQFIVSSSSLHVSKMPMFSRRLTGFTKE